MYPLIKKEERVQLRNDIKIVYTFNLLYKN